MRRMSKLYPRRDMSPQDLLAKRRGSFNQYVKSGSGASALINIPATHERRLLAKHTETTPDKLMVASALPGTGWSHNLCSQRPEDEKIWLNHCIPKPFYYWAEAIDKHDSVRGQQPCTGCWSRDTSSRSDPHQWGETCWSFRDGRVDGRPSKTGYSVRKDPHRDPHKVGLRHTRRSSIAGEDSRSPSEPSSPLPPSPSRSSPRSQSPRSGRSPPRSPNRGGSVVVSRENVYALKDKSREQRIEPMKRMAVPAPIPIGDAAKAAAQKMQDQEKIKLESEHGDPPSSIELWAAFKRSKIKGQEAELKAHAHWSTPSLGGGYSFKGSPRHTVCWQDGPLSHAEKSILIKNVSETGKKVLSM
eukprot:gnl/TRDRNA2_/TRDRNA2_59685_c0_seq1.p1 gnl/TRDRNA2_/TRDRNA2_59685_c0~~gnl/TRDRNA2_/TRDRNA2_59685_c0_seq1.p1  ORF type:complete len:358 (+),score=40.96 gnl/TRDRNA2_/TRDRNA2_59685_c0_seq1:1-1074(+)